jgi:putative transposase
MCLRDVELTLAERGIVVFYEAVRHWCKKFSTTFANWLRRRPGPRDKWHILIWQERAASSLARRQ